MTNHKWLTNKKSCFVSILFIGTSIVVWSMYPLIYYYSFYCLVLPSNVAFTIDGILRSSIEDDAFEKYLSRVISRPEIGQTVCERK